MSAAVVTYLLHQNRSWRNRHKPNRVAVIGPVFSQIEGAEKWCAEHRKIGWDARWVQVGLNDQDFAGYIV